jgi:hypothetical protein
MRDKYFNPPAFPFQFRDMRSGMTLSDYFAVKVLQSLIISNPAAVLDELIPISYQAADLMLKERNGNS